MLSGALAGSHPCPRSGKHDNKRRVMNTMARRSAVGLSLICALVFCALAAQGASAAEGKNTTAYECVKGGGSKDFSDAHCDNNVGAGKGEYGHVVLPLNEKITLSITNEKTKNETKEAAS